ncbi:MAG: ABC transporter permease [Planctomycetes bacterium]|nr:ABC transporter permease [Planctomycetota bacterium]
MRVHPWHNARDRALIVGLRVACALVLLFLLVPVLLVIPMGFSADNYLTFPPPGWSLQYFERVATDDNWLASMRNSFTIGIAVTLLATLLGTSAALGIARMRKRLRGTLLVFCLSPLVMPLVIPAVGLFFMYTELGMTATFAGMVFAHTLLAAPVVLLVVTASLQALNPNLERAAGGLGAPPLTAFTTITLPAIAPGIVTAALFAFITSFDEIILALFLAGTRQRTLPVKMFESIQFEVGLSTAAVGSLFVFLAAATLVGAEALRRKGDRRQRVRRA